MTRNRLKVSPGALAKRRFLQWALVGTSAVLLGGRDRLNASPLFTAHPFGVMAEAGTTRMHLCSSRFEP